jgi:catechol 2,3-dioxygenase-like lactoylglutathione lyase family enzyme
MKNPLTYGLTHLAIAVRDVKVTLKFYRQMFDMEVMYLEEKMIQLTTPGSHDVLVFEENPANVKDTGGIAHFGFRLKSPESIIEIRKRVTDAGAEIVEEGEFVPGSPYIFFKDPDGYIIEVWYELLPDEKSK